MSIKGPAALLAACCLAVSLQAPAQTRSDSKPASAAGSVFVTGAFGGTIFGYDVDENGSEGMLSEITDSGVAFETFDVATGEITAVVAGDTRSDVDYVTLGIFGSHMGLVEQDHGVEYVDKRRYLLSNPLQSHALTGEWTPPLTADDILYGASTNQAAATPRLTRAPRLQPLFDSAFLGQTNRSSTGMYVLGANLGKNVSGPRIYLDGSIFQIYSSVLATHLWGSRAVLVGAGYADSFATSTVATVDLKSGSIDLFDGLGYGNVNGLDVDPVTGIACATSYDRGVHFYDLRTHAGFSVELPDLDGTFAPNTVRFDPVNRLFLIAQPAYHSDRTSSYIHVLDEQGNYVELIDQGLHLPASPVEIALNPRRRIGYVLETPNLNRLQSFTY